MLFVLFGRAAGVKSLSSALLARLANLLKRCRSAAARLGRRSNPLLGVGDSGCEVLVAFAEDIIGMPLLSPRLSSDRGLCVKDDLLRLVDCPLLLDNVLLSEEPSY